jgi:hypothetical protein
MCPSENLMKKKAAADLYACADSQRLFLLEVGSERLLKSGCLKSYPQEGDS